MTDETQELIRRGEDAEVLLASTAFAETLADLYAGWNQELYQSAPGDTERREEMYRLTMALQYVEANLAVRVATKNNILVAQADAEQEEEE